MVIYSIILFAIAALFLALGTSVYRGNTKLIHDYHQTKVQETERLEYGRAFAAGLFALCATLLISGTAALLNQKSVSLAILFLGLILSIVILIKVQRKYNGGIF